MDLMDASCFIAHKQEAFHFQNVYGTDIYLPESGFFQEERYFFPSDEKKWVFTGKKTFLLGRNSQRSESL